MSTYMKRQRRRVGVPQFLGKIFNILENGEFSEIITWTQMGDSFVIKDWKKFQDRVLPVYFKHKNFQSFLRQLNMYSFVKKKCKDGSNSFKHKNFKRNQMYSLCLTLVKAWALSREEITEKHKNRLKMDLKRKVLNIKQTKAQKSQESIIITQEIQQQLHQVSTLKINVQLLHSQIQQALLCQSFLQAQNQQLQNIIQPYLLQRLPVAAASKVKVEESVQTHKSSPLFNQGSLA